MTQASQGGAGVTARARPEPHRSRLELAVVPAAVSIARRWTAYQLAGTGQGAGSADLIDSAVLAVSELVTNAIAAVSIDAAASFDAAASEDAAADRDRPRLALELPGRILSFGDLPYGPGLPGSALVPRSALLPAAAGCSMATAGSGLVHGSRLAPGAMRQAGSPRRLSPAPGAAPASVSLVIARFSAFVRIEVHDSSRIPLPPTCHRDAQDETGRGLMVVAALARNWGWQLEPSGKVVWCELAS